MTYQTVRPRRKIGWLAFGVFCPVSIILSMLWTALAQDAGRQVNEMKPQGEYAKIDNSRILHDMKVFEGTDNAAKDSLVKAIESKPGDYAPPVFMGMAGRLFEQKQAEKAYFWFCFGRLRGRYDAARCADVSAREGIDVMAMKVNPELRKYILKMKPEEIVPFAKKVIKLDADTPCHYDHRWLNLHGMGAFLNTKELSLPEAEWPALHKEVQQHFLKDAEEAAESRKVEAK